LLVPGPTACCTGMNGSPVERTQFLAPVAVVPALTGSEGSLAAAVW